MSFQIYIEEVDTNQTKTVIITPSGEFTTDNTTTFKESLDSQVISNAKLVLNLAHINIISDYAIGVIIYAHKILKESGSGGEIHLCLLQDKVLKAFLYKRLDLVIPIHNNLEDAIASLN